ncbi:MAG: DegT/DnrJ/EryC1/StrS family aminotransferase [Gammaproteobacteria bacterium]
MTESRNGESVLQEIISPYTSRYFDSGTAALAASILAAISIKGVSEPEVILPAYGCPDLISAVVYAGAQPVLVDLEAERPWMDLEQVSSHITARTVAIIAASLCGIPERLGELRQITEQAGVALIEDSAQLFPGSIAEADWQGDMVVISFGRGKPVSLLGGGAVMFRDEGLGSLVPDYPARKAGMGQRLGYRLKVLLYNRLLAPRSYWALQWFPLLHLGETRYHPLESVGPLDSIRRRMLKANIACYLGQNPDMRIRISGMIDSLADNGIVNLPVACQLPVQQRLLRHPLLVDSTRRDQVYARLSEAGLGVSIMYPAILPTISGLETLLAGQGPFPAAEQFAARLLTLPTHAGVRRDDIEAMAVIMGSHLL